MNDDRARFLPALFPGFAKSATIEEIAKHGDVLTPGRYVGAEEVEDDAEPFAEKYPRLVAEVEECLAEGDRPAVCQSLHCVSQCSGLFAA